MKRHLVLVAVLLAVSHAALFAIGTITEIKLAEGYNDDNRITAPVFDAATVAPIGIAIKSGFDRSAKIVRRGATGFFTRGPEYNLDKRVDVAATFADALRAEGAALGFRMASGADAGWRIEATIKDVYLESKQIPYGATLFYGFLDLDAQVTGSDGRAERYPMRFHSYYGGYNAGMGRKDEAGEALANLLVESAQEALARLNRRFFKAAPRADVEAKIGQLRAGTPLGNNLYVVGLSGAAAATPALLGIVPSEVDENRRSALINAIGRAGAPEAVAPLAARYGTEDEDCRWYILKAMDYIGGDAALALVKSQGTKDKDGGPRRLAERIATGR
jgi:hypothetical protein